MKKIQFLAVTAMVVAFGAIAHASTDVKPASITVVHVKGEARYSIDGKSWHPLVTGKILHEGAVIETAANSSADLVLSGTPVPIAEETTTPESLSMLSLAPDPNIRQYVTAKPMAEQNIIHMDEDTMLAVDKLTSINTGADTVSNTELDLRAGGVFTNVKKMSASSQYIIKLPNGVAGIRGSEGHLKSDGSTEWVHGLITLSLIGKDGQPHVVTVHGGFDYNPQTGEITNMTGALEKALEDEGINAETLYAHVSYSEGGIDVTQIRLSPTQGIPGQNGQGQNGNGQGGNGQGGAVITSIGGDVSAP